MNQSSLEELENIRRIAERGIICSVNNKDSSMTDIFQHILDLVENIKSYEQNTRNN